MNRTNPELRERQPSMSSLLFRPQFKALALSLTLLTAAITAGSAGLFCRGRSEMEEVHEPEA